MQKGSDGGTQGICFRLWEFHCEVDTVKDPTKNFLSGVPYTFSFKDEFLLGDWILTIMASGCQWREDLMDGVQEGTTEMEKDGRVSGLERCTIIVYKRFKEVSEL